MSLSTMVTLHSIFHEYNTMWSKFSKAFLSTKETGRLFCFKQVHIILLDSGVIGNHHEPITPTASKTMCTKT